MKKLNLSLWIATMVGLCIMLGTIFFPGINGDEVFSLNIVRGSFWQITTDTAKDVHPPLYYYILKFGTMFVSKVFAEFVVIIVAKLISIIPLIITILFAIKIMKPYLGADVIALFSFCIVWMPKMMMYSTEIRMYTWCYLFVVLSAWYVYKIIEENKKSDWLAYLFWGLCACYTHYFAAVAIIVIHIFLFVYSLKKKIIKSWIISSIAFTLLYLPWLLVLFEQFFDKSHLDKHAGWIPPVTVLQIIKYYLFMLTSRWNDTFDMIASIVGSLILLLVLLYFIKLLKRKTLTNLEMFMIGLIGVPFGVIAIGATISLLFQPVFTTRYVFVALGLFWLGLSIGINKLLETNKNATKKYVPFLIYFFLILMIFMNSISYIIFELTGRV